MASLSELLYGYVPTKYVAIIFLVLFVLSTIAHIPTIRFSFWAVWPAIICGLLEIIGWSARLASSIHPDRSIPFELQLAVTLFAPTGIAHLSANMLQSLVDTANFDSLFKTRKFIFGVVLSCGITACYLIQIVGGGLAATAIHKGKSTAWPEHLMYVGTVFHLAVFAAQIVLVLCSFVHGMMKGVKSWRSLQFLLLGFSLSTACLLVRLGYRVAALKAGLASDIARNQLYFNVMDGTMVLLAMVALNVVLPMTLRYFTAFQSSLDDLDLE